MGMQITEKSKKNLQSELLPEVTRKSKLYAKEYRTAYLFILAPVLGFLIFIVGQQYIHYMVHLLTGMA